MGRYYYKPIPSLESLRQLRVLVADDTVTLSIEQVEDLLHGLDYLIYVIDGDMKSMVEWRKEMRKLGLVDAEGRELLEE